MALFCFVSPNEWAVTQSKKEEKSRYAVYIGGGVWKCIITTAVCAPLTVRVFKLSPFQFTGPLEKQR